MRTIAKTLFLLLLCVSLGNVFATTQDSIPKESYTSQILIDSLQSEISRLNGIVEEGNYTRVPNEDFDNIIENKIQKSLRDTLRWWLIVIGALISVFGFLITKYNGSLLQNIVDERINKVKEEMRDDVKKISNQYFSSVIESLIAFRIDLMSKGKFKVDEEEINDLEKYLSDDFYDVSTDTKVKLIDTIMRCYYYSTVTNKNEKMIKLIERYEENYTLLHTTYANAAIALSDRYEKYGTKDFLNSAIENIDKSLRILPDYGLAFAQKLELYMMAVSKAFDEKERKAYEAELKRVFKDIDNNHSKYVCKELIARLEVDESTFMAPFVKRLFKEYPTEMEKIKSRAEAEK